MPVGVVVTSDWLAWSLEDVKVSEPAGSRDAVNGTPALVLRPKVLELGAAYLGGTGLTAVANAGLITEATPGSLAALSTAMSWEPAPWCPMTF